MLVRKRRGSRCKEKRVEVCGLGSLGLGGQGEKQEPARSLEAVAGEMRGNQGS